MLANIYLNDIRAHVDLLVRRGRVDKLVIWDIGSDEAFDPTLIAQRLYGNRDDADVVIMCAGNNRIGEKLPQQRIYLPAPITLAQIKRNHVKRGVAFDGD